MARVQQAGFQTVEPKLQPTPATQSDASAAAFGALSGQALQNVGQGFESLGSNVSSIVQDIMQENLQRHAKDLDNQYADAQRKLLYGDGTQDNPGLMNLKGQDALTAFPKVQQQMADLRANIGQQAGNTVVTNMFDASANERDDTVLQRSLMHVSQQRQIANDASSEARIGGAMADGALGYHDPNTTSQQWMIVQNEVEDQAKRNGFSPETTDNLVKQKKGEYWDKVITNAMQFDTKTARSLLNQHLEDLGGLYGGVVQDKLKAQENENVNRSFAQEEHVHRMKEYAQEDNANYLTSQIAAGKMGLPEIQDATAKGLIDRSRSAGLIEYANTDWSKRPGNAKRANDLLVGVYNGSVTAKDIQADQTISQEQSKNLLQEGDRINTQGGNLAFRVVKDKQDYIKLKTVGDKGLLSGLNPDESERLANAQQEFAQKVMGVTADQLTADNLNTWSEAVVNKYSEPSKTAARAIKALPTSKYFTTPIVSTKDTLVANHDAGVSKLMADQQTNAITPEEFTREWNTLKAINEQIQRIPDIAPPIQKAK